MTTNFQRVIALVAALAVMFPASVFAESRNRQRTDLERLAADLERVLGAGSVRVERRDARPAADSAPPVMSSSAYDAILEAMNRERAAYGLAPLRMNQKLSAAAGDRIDDMFAKHYFDHVSPDGIEPFVWARNRGYRYRLIGENLAVGYRGKAVVDGWMRSPGHRENILQRSFNEVGLAIADGSPRRGYRGPTVVAMYGAR